jgi:hypothetical protein
MNYDNASWHYGGDFPEELPDEAGATHMGMYLAWAWSVGLVSAEFSEEMKALAERTRTPGEFLFSEFDEKLAAELFNDEGNDFTSSYYSADGSQVCYNGDYESVLGAGVESLYSVDDSWDNFEKLKPILDARLEAWRNPPRKRFLGFLGRDR